MHIEEIINSYGKPIKIIGDQRIEPRFKLSNLFIRIENKDYPIENISNNGIGIFHNDNFKNNHSIRGKIIYKNELINIQLICMHNNGSFAGFKFIHSQESLHFLNLLLSPSNISQNLKLKRIKNSDWLCYSSNQNNFLIKFSADKQTELFLFAIGETIVLWNQQGISTGLYNSKLENPNDAINSIIIDPVVDSKKISFFKKIIEENTSIPVSFKDWILDKIKREF